MKTFLKILIPLLIVLAAACGHDSLPTETEPPETEPPLTTTVYHGITLVSLPGGSFQMGDTTGNSDELPIHAVTLSPFEMSAYEITNAQYAAFLNEALAAGEINVVSGYVKGVTGDYAGCDYIHLAGYDYSGGPEDSCWVRYTGTAFIVRAGKEHWPVVYVNWSGAKAFAGFYGLDLPTEAQWEYASRAGKQYEWGTDDGTFSVGKGNVTPYWHPVDIGGYAPNPFKLYDLVGNVSEWCRDLYASEYYSVSPRNDPAGPATNKTTEGRVIRGSSFGSNDFFSRSASRIGYLGSEYFGSSVGFRVVRN
ncbi:formylglycine-generating enzyme family protein [bacterium]|nr:formylglycine-generating enzyme family protein [bacterium]